LNFDQLTAFFATSPAARLLRSPHAAQVAWFLHATFKAGDSSSVPHSELAERLGSFLERIHTESSTGQSGERMTDTPDAYLATWTSGPYRWLRRYHSTSHAEPVYELTPHTELVLKFLAEALDSGVGFVGTESRLKRITDALADIVVRGSHDPERRLEHLRSERDKLDREIAAIEAGDEVETYSPTAVRERFADAVGDLTSLQSDFRAVEESFREITRDVQRRQAEAASGRGEILGYVLDAEDRLKTDDQGVSFDAFVSLVLSPRRQEELEELVDQLQRMSELAGQSEGMARIREMVGRLSAEAEKVLRTTRRLSSTLRRLLDPRSGATRLRLAEVLHDIKASAARLANEDGNGKSTDSIGLSVPMQAELVNPFQRSFWKPPTDFEMPSLVIDEPDEIDCYSAFQQLAGMERLDWDGMRGKVDRMLASGPTHLPLPDLLEVHPVTAGVLEVLGYLQIAHEDGHEVDEQRTTRLVVQVEGKQVEYDAPHVVFVKRGLRREAAALQA